MTAYEEDEDTGRTVAAPPVFPVHIDHTVEGGPKRIQRHLTEEEIEKYMNDRFRARIIKSVIVTTQKKTAELIASVWRPIDNPVEDCPLAVCDPRHIDIHDLIATDRVTPDFAVEMYYVRFNSNQKWFWLRKQTTSELTVFVNYDSQCRIDGPNEWRSEFFQPHAVQH